MERNESGINESGLIPSWMIGKAFRMEKDVQKPKPQAQKGHTTVWAKLKSIHRVLSMFILMMLVQPMGMASAFDIWVVQYGNTEQIPCDRPEMLLVCYNNPKQILCGDRDCVKAALTRDTRHVWYFQCFASDIVTQISGCSVQEFGVGMSLDIVPKKSEEIKK